MISNFIRTTVVVAALGLNGLISAQDRPNILWITSEDNGPYLGCYGDPIARTPNLDRLAKTGTRYRNCFSNAAVCAPARQTLIAGMYATSLGGQHMRSDAVFPAGVPYFPKYLREAGYHTSNNSKTDYNGGPADRKEAMKATWDESGSRAHWRKRPDGKPFFSVFNITLSHESRLFAKGWNKRELKTDPATVKLPAYLPDLPETRRDLARYYDCLETMDASVGKVLAELAQDGLGDDTIIFYYGDHGGSLPRGKSFTYDSGTRVPLIVHIPERWKHLRPTQRGGETGRLVSFVDFAATVLSLVGHAAPEYMQGRAFLGERAKAERKFVHTFRGRRGERYDLVRGVRSKRFLYLRNYTPHLPVMQFNGYSFAIPGYPAWRKAWQEGRCTPVQAQWFEPKAAEELYAIESDPDNVRNLAADPAYAEELHGLRAENERHILAIRDSVFFPEGMSGREFAAYQDEQTYPLQRLLSLAAKVSGRDAGDLPEFRNALLETNSAIRYWGVMGYIVLGKAAAGAASSLPPLLTDPEPLIRIQAARALAGIGHYKESVPVLRNYLAAPDQVLQLRAVLAIDECGLLGVDPSLSGPLKKVRGAYGKRVAQRIFTATAGTR
jgi:N-sulfoglucosamine sulfohydrolase